jgi:hypothetical protein
MKRSFLSFVARCALSIACCSASLLIAPPLRAEIMLVDFDSFDPLAPAITFSGDIDYLTFNPTFDYSDLEGFGDQTVSFGTHFVGQTLGDPNTLTSTSPEGSLALSTDATVANVIDLSKQSIALGGVNTTPEGTSYFTTPIAILFDNPVGFVGFGAGHFDEAGTIMIEAFDQDGNSLGIVKNPEDGEGVIAITDSSGENVIAGVSLYLTEGMDWEGFTVDDVVFGAGADGIIPEPPAMLIWAVLAGLAFLARGVRRGWKK